MMKVLVVEDTVTSAYVVCNQLANMGLTALHAQDGETGLEIFKRERPDLILLDIVMPGLDGFEVAHRIRQLEQDGDWTPIIFLTSRTDDRDLQRAIDVGGDDYLIKPVSEIVLRAKVNAMRRLAQMRDSLLLLTRKLDEANRELQRLSSVDGLTNIANRRNFDEKLLHEWRHCSRMTLPLSLLIIDVDAFKLFNDHYGHQFGDECLKAVARELEKNSHRPNDLVARYGGEEFGVILPDTMLEGAQLVAEAMRAGVEGLGISHSWSPVSSVVTISIGLATIIPPRGSEGGISALIRAADDALYQAKEGGRNRVQAALGVIRVAGIGVASVVRSPQ
ncbi:diguanylate cyclase response regulator [Betaproteobacteria bacterium]|nr:diguanylate cyclase response regulator [Betaproteobacteria bacterium]GHT99988.1 diguanylate cyclase response regulator [Betaproteobacteria bacterium]GHU22858.1 diguanylate cyclase response regulator [Betaproteobacteria bacterium]